jgi:hypothetical protein
LYNTWGYKTTTHFNARKENSKEKGTRCIKYENQPDIEHKFPADVCVLNCYKYSSSI